MVPDEIFSEFEVKDLTFEKEEEVTHLVKWKNFEKFMRDQIADEGIFFADLIKEICGEYGIDKSTAWTRTRKFVAKHNDKYEITEKIAVGDTRFKYVQKRR